MKINLYLFDHFDKSVELTSEKGQIIGMVNTSGDLFLSLCELLKKNRKKLHAVKSIEVHYNESSSRTSVRSAFALANALLYSLGLRKVEEWGSPPKPEKFY